MNCTGNIVPQHSNLTRFSGGRSNVAERTVGPCWSRRLRHGIAAICLGLVVSALTTSPLRARTGIVHEGLTAKDQVLLTEIQQRAVRFFVDHTDSGSGLTRDRAPTSGAPGSAASSIAATRSEEHTSE